MPSSVHLCKIELSGVWPKRGSKLPTGQAMVLIGPDEDLLLCQRGQAVHVSDAAMLSQDLGKR